MSRGQPDTGIYGLLIEGTWCPATDKDANAYLIDIDNKKRIRAYNACVLSCEPASGLYFSLTS